MKTNEEGNGKRIFMIPFTSKARAVLLVEIAQSKGLDGWLEEGNRFEVCLCADEDDVRSAVETVWDGDELLHLKQLEAMALTVQGLGERPSKTLTEAIAIQRRRVGRGKNNNRPPNGLNGDRLSGPN